MVLAPGDSTVVELAFKTKTYKTMVNKNATIYSNDLANSQSKIYVSAKVYEAQDATLPISWGPDQVRFTEQDNKFEVVVTNKSANNMNLSSLEDAFDGLSMKIKNSEIKPGKQAKIEFEWKGEFQKENLERSLTFIAVGDSETRFTVPFFVAGTNPTPPKAAPKKTITPSEKTIDSPASGQIKIEPKKSGD